MATLNEFVDSHLKQSFQERLDYETDFRACGGQVLILSPGKRQQFVGLGVFSGILPYVDGDVKSSESEDFQALKSFISFDHNNIFSPNSSRWFTELVLCNCLHITPEACTDDAMTDALSTLSDSIGELASALESVSMAKIIDTVSTIRQNVSKERMREILGHDSYLGNALIANLPQWTRTAGIEVMPQQHAAAIVRYNTFRGICREGTYTIGLAPHLKQSTFLHRASLPKFSGRARAVDVLITDTPQELTALAESYKNNHDLPILYRGPLMQGADAAQELQGRGYQVICADIRGPQEFVEHLGK